MTTPNTAPIAALLADHPDLCAAVLCALVAIDEEGGEGVASIEHYLWVYDRIMPGRQMIERILSALASADIAEVTKDQTWSLIDWSHRYAIARVGALGWLRECCGVVTESDAPARDHRRSLDGFKRAARYDGARRRSIWYRTRPDGIELRAGREGDDEQVRLALGDTIDAGTIEALDDLLRTNAWATEMTEDANDLDEVDDLVGPFGLRDQNRALDAEQIDRLCRANMRSGMPWGCADVDMLALRGAEEKT